MIADGGRSTGRPGEARRAARPPHHLPGGRSRRSCCCTWTPRTTCSRVAEVVTATGVDVLVVGRGSNLLVADAGFPGLAVVLGEALRRRSTSRAPTWRPARRPPLPVVARRTVAAGLTGFEWAVGVPGSIGGAVRMNAGGHGSDMAASLTRIRVIDLRSGEDGWVPAAALDLGYRTSSDRAPPVVVAARLALAVGDPDAGERRAGGDRGVAPGQPARRAQRRVRLHQPRTATLPVG